LAAELVGLGQTPGDVPEGFASMAALRRSGVSRAGRIAAATGFTLPVLLVLLGATNGFFAVRGGIDLLELALLALLSATLWEPRLGPRAEMTERPHHGPCAATTRPPWPGGGAQAVDGVGRRIVEARGGSTSNDPAGTSRELARGSIPLAVTGGISALQPGATRTRKLTHP
jgi:hypothetical protein